MVDGVFLGFSVVAFVGCVKEDWDLGASNCCLSKLGLSASCSTDGTEGKHQLLRE